MPFYDPETEKNLSPDERFRLYARRLKLWQLCCNSKCRRAQSCRGELTQCAHRFADWAEAVRDGAQREFGARDPQTQVLRAELKERFIRLSQTLASD
jgi:hypothetical protein